MLETQYFIEQLLPGMVFKYVGKDKSLKKTQYTIENSDPVYTSFFLDEDFTTPIKKFTDEVFDHFVKECQLLIFPPKIKPKGLYVHTVESTIYQIRGLATDHLIGNSVVIYSRVIVDDNGIVVNRDKKIYTISYIEFCLRFIDFDKEMLK